MFAVLVVIHLVEVCPCVHAGDPWQKQSVVFKTVGLTRIEADVYRRNGNVMRPCLVWIHGGGLIMGSRQGVRKRIIELCRTNNFVLISLDYRLAPQVKLPAIIEDIQDAFRWIEDEGRKQFHLDPARLVVAGESAGGYLTMMTGICVEPRPTALVAYWGYGDVDGDWYSKPSAYYRRMPAVRARQARRAAQGPVTTTGNDPARGKYYLYLRQNGLWTREVTGFDPKTERAKLDPYCPVRSIGRDYPPILMIHGTADTDVPYEKSAEMAAALRAKGIAHELITVDGGGHGLGGANPEAIDDAHRRALEFIRAQLGE